MNYLILDLETTTKEMYGRKGHWLYNDIVAIGLKYNDYGVNEQDCGRITGGPYGIYDNEPPKNWLNYIEIIVGHNIKYDLLYLWNREDLQEWFKKGGRIWDTQLAHYMLTAQQEAYPALRDIAVRCYGCKYRDKEMEPYWEKRIDTNNIPEEIVLKDVKNDVLDTEVIFLTQLRMAKEKKMFNLIELEMEAILATTEIEYNGMFVDKEILKSNKAILEKELQRKQDYFLTLIKDYWKESL